MLICFVSPRHQLTLIFAFSVLSVFFLCFLSLFFIWFTLQAGSIEGKASKTAKHNRTNERSNETPPTEKLKSWDIIRFRVDEKRFYFRLHHAEHQWKKAQREKRKVRTEKEE
jgi:ABC-type transport system involved in cytochrome bd biosynthesis fused ATPase/permease subunit